MTAPLLIDCMGRFSFDLSSRTHIMGILNVTPDSFSDGGKFFGRDAAIAHAMAMQSAGADIIDVGGMSTRPGSVPVSVQEEMDRVVPVIEALSPHLKVPISIDTYRAEVAEGALKAGATIINDISGLRFDAHMAPLAAKHRAPVIVMHIKGTPRDMQVKPEYEAMIPEVMDYLRMSIQIAEEAGVRDIIIDPGIGFGKTFEHNLEIIARLGEFIALSRPVLVGASRKAFIGAALGGAPQDKRLMGTAAVVAACALAGVHIVRVHDVAEMTEVVRMSNALRLGRLFGA